MGVGADLIGDLQKHETLHASAQAPKKPQTGANGAHLEDRRHVELHSTWIACCVLRAACYTTAGTQAHRATCGRCLRLAAVAFAGLSQCSDLFAHLATYTARAHAARARRTHLPPRPRGRAAGTTVCTYVPCNYVPCIWTAPGPHQCCHPHPPSSTLLKVAAAVLSPPSMPRGPSPRPPFPASLRP